MFIFKTGDYNDLIPVAVSQKARKAGNLDGASQKWGCWACFFLFKWLWLIGAAEAHYRPFWAWNENSHSFLCCFNWPEQTQEFQCKVGKGAWMDRKVLDPLLKMLSSTLLCWKLKLPVMTLLGAEASAQTGSRSVRTWALPREVS